MSAALPPLPVFASPRRRTRRAWRPAWRALQRLLDDPDDTVQAYRVTLALDPSLPARGLQRTLLHPEGRRLLRERPSLGARLGDTAALEGLPEGSLGRAYLAHLRRYDLRTDKLVELVRENTPDWASLDADERFVLERSQLLHDLWHVLTGYGADPLGEAALLPFSFAQQGGAANLLLALGAALGARGSGGRGWLRYLLRAWRRGRRAAPLLAMPYEELLAHPLPDVRCALGIEAPERAHPGGVRALAPEDAAAFRKAKAAS